MRQMVTPIGCVSITEPHEERGYGDFIELRANACAI
jgi:hypothetical protein